MNGVGYWTPDPMEGLYIRRKYQVVCVRKQNLDVFFWEVGYDTLEEAQEQRRYLTCAEHWNDYLFYILELPDK